MVTSREQVDTARYQPVMTDILAILMHYDPVNIVSVQASGERAQAYSPEARVMIDRLQEIECPNALRNEVDGMLRQWFGPAANRASQQRMYDAMAHEICTLWQDFQIRIPKDGSEAGSEA